MYTAPPYPHNDLARIRTTAGNSQARKYDDRPIYAVISEEFVSDAGEVVLTLSLPPPKEVPGAAVPLLNLPSSVTRRAAAVSRPRCARRFAFLELAVDRPIDLVVGSRYLDCIS